MTTDAGLGAAKDTVLVVDPQVLVRMAIAQYLRDCGYRVVEAAGAGEAVVILQHRDMRLDVVLLALDGSGSAPVFALSHWIRANRPGVGVILAGTPARAATAAGELCEQGPTLAKPYEPAALIERIRRLLADRAD